MMPLKPQCTIEKSGPTDQPVYSITKEENGESTTLDTSFASHLEAMDHILAQGWQLKRPKQDASMIVETRFLKP